MQFGVVLVVPPVSGYIHGTLAQGHHGVDVAAGVNHFAEKLIGVDLHAVQSKAGNVVARCGVGIDQTNIFALEVSNGFVRRIGLDIENRVVTFDATFGNFNGKRACLDTDHAGAGIRGWAVESDMNLLGALAFDHRGVVTGNT